jgi:exopolysaccharide production protein ExoQ
VRSFVEVDVINPYVVGSFLLYYAAGLLASQQCSEHPAAATQPHAHLWRSAA